MTRGLLLKFSFKNFRSFADETEIDLTATNIKENSDTLILINGNKILPVAALFGANASGKSNFFYAFSAMQDKVLDNGSRKNKNPESNPFIVPFIFSEKEIEEPTEFEVCINIDNKEYRYGFECDKTKIISEWLYSRPYSKTTKATEKIIFERDKEQFNFGKLSKAQLNEFQYCKTMILNNQLLINAIGVRKKIVFSKIFEWFYMSAIYNFSTDVSELNELRAMAEFLYKNKEILKKISDQIHEIDPAILKINVQKTKDDELNDVYKFLSYHQFENRKNYVSFSIESSGTRKMLALYLDIFFALQIGGPLFIDELDAKLHPLLLRKIVQMFSNPIINTGHGQIIFSSHNLVCLDSSDLRRDEIWFVEKKEQKSTMFSLYDFKDYNENSIRSDLSFGKHYLAGRFGAIPFQEVTKSD